MSNFTAGTARRRGLVAGLVAVGIAASVVGTGDAEARALPNGQRSVTGVDGQKVTISRSGERAVAMPSVANNGAGRSAAVSGTYRAKLSKGSGAMTVGYLVGCQVNITGLQGGLSGTIGLNSSLSGSISVPLMPGQVAFVHADGLPLTKGHGTMMIDGFQIDVQQCGGYASARSVVQVMAADGLSTEGDILSGDNGFVQSTLYGAPFSLG